MVFAPRYTVDVPHKDVLSLIFDDLPYDWNRPLFIDADDPTKIITAARLLQMVKRIGRGLRASAGVRAGDVVLFCSANRVFSPALILGTLCAGAAISGANPVYTESELVHQIKDSGARAVFIEESKLDLALKCCAALGVPREQVFLFTDERGPRRGVRTLGDLMEYGEMEWERLDQLEDLQGRLAALNYSSGTTGLPKGCEISMYNMVANCTQTLHTRNIAVKNNPALDYPRVHLAYVPFYHAMGQQIYCINATKAGDVTYVMNAFSFDKLLDAITAFRVTDLALVPPVAVLFAKHPRVARTDLASVRAAACGAAPLGRAAHLQAEAALAGAGARGLRIQQAWGMSEATLAATVFGPGEHDADVCGVGFLMPNVYAKIVDDDGRELGVDEPGEILLKGPNMFRGYWRNPTATRDSFTPDGYYKTGDIAVMKPNGIVHIVDRKKELIKVKGYQVAPAELEDLLLKSPDVADAAVIGVPIEGTELPRAYIVPARPDAPPPPRVFAEYVAARLAPYKRLAGGVVLVAAVPKSPSGKILRRELRERAAREMAAAEKERAKL